MGGTLPEYEQIDQGVPFSDQGIEWTWDPITKKWYKNCSDCGRSIQRGQMSLWGMCKTCENGRLSV